MKGQAQKEARYIRSALKMKRKVKGKNPYKDNHIILCNNSHYCSTWRDRYLDKNGGFGMKELEEKNQTYLFRVPKVFKLIHLWRDVFTASFNYLSGRDSIRQ